MKRSLLVLLSPLLLAGCINQSASYYIDGPNHSLTLRAEQDYFWDKQVLLKAVAAHMPDCQRLFVFTSVAPADLIVDLFGAGENVYSLRAGAQVIRVDTTGCTRLTDPTAAELGQKLGTFHLDAQQKMVFDKEAGAPAPAPAAPPAAN